MDTRRRIENAWLMLDAETPLLARRQSAFGQIADLFGSAVFQLVEHVYRSYPDSARHHLRKPIFVDGEPTLAESALVRSAAKRLRLVAQAPRHGKTIDLGPPPPPTSRESDRVLDGEDLARTLQLRITERTESNVPLYLQDRPVSALLVNAQGEIEFSARNESTTARCLHAEINLLRRMSAAHDAFPPGRLIAVSLKPCRMCAAFLVASARALSDLRVVYLEDDPGRLASGTILDAESPGRLEFLRDREGLPPSDAQKIIADVKDYRLRIQKKASTIEGFERLSIAEIQRGFSHD